MNFPLVSIVMPAYNASLYIREAIESVLAQTYLNWELLVVNDGSKDDTGSIVKSFSDPRIFLFEQTNQGVSMARNHAMDNLRGDFLCFLDADDALPPNSIASRIRIFASNPEIEFVDGWVEVFDANLEKVKKMYRPAFKGQPFSELIALSDSCYFGLTWMIRINKEKKYRFAEGMSHAEDLLFFITIAKNGLYDFVDEPVLQYRTGGKSAMSNLKGLERGYIKLFKSVEHIEMVEKKSLVLLWRKIMMVMCKSWLKEYRFVAAIKFMLRFFKIRYLL